MLSIQKNKKHLDFFGKVYYSIASDRASLPCCVRLLCNKYKRNVSRLYKERIPDPKTAETWFLF